MLKLNPTEHWPQIVGVTWQKFIHEIADSQILSKNFYPKILSEKLYKKLIN